MSAIEVKAVVVLTSNTWGKGATLAAAEAEVKRVAYRSEAQERKAAKKGSVSRVIYLLDCDPSEVTVNDMGSPVYPEGANAMRMYKYW